MKDEDNERDPEDYGGDSPSSGSSWREKQPPNNKKFDLWLGLAIPLVVGLGIVGIDRLFFVYAWLLQWIYVLPVALTLQYRGKIRMAQGMWIMTGALTLINLALCGYVLSNIH